MRHYILYNPQAANQHGRKRASALESRLSAEGQVFYQDITAIDDLDAYLADLPAQDQVIVSGGDGTLHWLANRLGEKPPLRELLYHAAGSGNDFQKDVAPGRARHLIRLNEFLEKLPTVEVQNYRRRFLNGVGFGLDGYCCSEGERIRATGRHVRYTTIGLLALLYQFHPVNAEITVDGKRRTYERVWMAPTMQGKFFGGGVKIAPGQDRMNPQRKLTVVVLHDAGRLQTLMAFPTALWGGHVAFRGMVEILTGWDVTVKFDKPAPMQIDGEIVQGVRAYHARSALAPVRA